MRRLTRVAVVVAVVVVALVLAGCGDSSSDRDRGSPASSTSTTGPVTDDGAQMVEPRSGMARVHAVTFDSATPTSDGRALEVRFTGGVAPCFVLDRVDVDERVDDVVVTLFAGTEPSAQDAACIQIAALYVTTVALDTPLAGREIVDGAAG